MIDSLATSLSDIESKNEDSTNKLFDIPNPSLDKVHFFDT